MSNENKQNEKLEWEKAIDSEGYAIAAAKILDALKLVIGQDVTEFAMPVIIQLMKNNIREPLTSQLEEAKRENERLTVRIKTYEQIIRNHEIIIDLQKQIIP